MKFVTSILMLLSFELRAAPIRVFYEGDDIYAIAIRDVLVKEYQIPYELIEVSKNTSCEKLNKSGKLDLCLKNNGDLKMVSVNREFVSETLKIFRAP